MIRIRWFETDKDAPFAPVEWRMASIVLATLFFNFIFVERYSTPPGLWLSLPLSFALLVPVAAILTALFFAGPAFACRAANRPLLRVVEDSVGSVPAAALRFCFALFLGLWMAAMVAFPVHWWSLVFRTRTVSSFESGAVGAAVLLFLFATGHQALVITSRLALFTNKLALVIFVAALIRVRDGWAATLAGSQWNGWYYSVWMGVSELAAYMAPLGLVAANYGCRICRRRDLMLTLLCGVAVPLLATLSLVGLIWTATSHSRFYQPSLTPTVGMALWSHTARSALGGRLLVAGVTTFGALRFVGREITDILGVRFPGSRRGWLLVSSVIVAISWLAVHPNATVFQSALDWSGRCLAVTSGIITVDLLTTKRRPERPCRIDRIGLAALAAGLAAPLFIPHVPLDSARQPWWYPWALPSYAISAIVCWIGRSGYRLATAHAPR